MAAASWESRMGTAPSGGGTTSGGPWRRHARSRTPRGSSPASEREAAAARPAPGWRPQITSIHPAVTSAARRRPRLPAKAIRPSDQPSRAVSPLSVGRFAGSPRRCSRSRARAGVIRASSGSHSPAVSIAAAASAGSSGGGEGGARRAWPRASRTAFSSPERLQAPVR